MAKERKASLPDINEGTKSRPALAPSQKKNYHYRGNPRGKGGFNAKRNSERGCSREGVKCPLQKVRRHYVAEKLGHGARPQTLDEQKGERQLPVCRKGLSFDQGGIGNQPFERRKRECTEGKNKGVEVLNRQPRPGSKSDPPREEGWSQPRRPDGRHGKPRKFRGLKQGKIRVEVKRIEGGRRPGREPIRGQWNVS